MKLLLPPKVLGKLPEETAEVVVVVPVEEGPRGARPSGEEAGWDMGRGLGGRLSGPSDDDAGCWCHERMVGT